MSKELAEMLDGPTGAPAAAREKFHRAQSRLAAEEVDWEDRMAAKRGRSDEGLFLFSHITRGESFLHADFSVALEDGEDEDIEAATDL